MQRTAQAVSSQKKIVLKTQLLSRGFRDLFKQKTGSQSIQKKSFETLGYEPLFYYMPQKCKKKESRGLT
jgi:hypothetical protein